MDFDIKLLLFNLLKKNQQTLELNGKSTNPSHPVIIIVIVLDVFAYLSQNSLYGTVAFIVTVLAVLILFVLLFIKPDTLRSDYFKATQTISQTIAYLGDNKQGLDETQSTQIEANQADELTTDDILKLL